MDVTQAERVAPPSHSRRGGGESGGGGAAPKELSDFFDVTLALKQIIQLFDSDGDGLVSPQEFKQALQAANIGLPETQINAILRVIERDERGRLDVKTFLDRCQVVYSAGVKAGGKGRGRCRGQK